MNLRTKLFLSEIHIRLILGVVVWVFDMYSEWKEGEPELKLFLFGT